ncbi:MAG: hypothetical protein AB1649_17815 [Chloroflexota bacterium]
MRILFLFLDGIGLGENNPEMNPFARAKTPFLNQLIGGQPLTRHAAPYESDRVSLLAVDACVGVDGPPQSATGQAILLTGKNIPAELGYHYGPKPNPEVAKFLGGPTIFSETLKAGKKAALLNAYPPRYFGGIESGKRLYSSIPLAVTNAGLPLFTKDDLYAGRALAADFTGEGWIEMLGFDDAPVYQPIEAGAKLAELAGGYDFSLFEYWASDYAGHKQDMPWAVRQLEIFDDVLRGLLSGADWQSVLLLITSDHGNMEDLSTRRHTDAKVPLLVIGSSEARRGFAGIQQLTEIEPAMAEALHL